MRTAGVALQLGESPCDSCHLMLTCKTQSLACLAFIAHCDGDPWEKLERRPTAELFRRVFRLRSPEEYEKLEQQLARVRERYRQTLMERGRRAGRKRAKEAACV